MLRWCSDQSTNTECFALGSSQTQTHAGLGTSTIAILGRSDDLAVVSSKSICYETKVVEAFSWTIFLLRTPDTCSSSRTF